MDEPTSVGTTIMPFEPMYPVIIIGMAVAVPDPMAAVHAAMPVLLVAAAMAPLPQPPVSPPVLALVAVAPPRAPDFCSCLNRDKLKKRLRIALRLPSLTSFARTSSIHTPICCRKHKHMLILFIIWVAFFGFGFTASILLHVTDSMTLASRTPSHRSLCRSLSVATQPAFSR